MSRRTNPSCRCPAPRPMKILVNACMLQGRDFQRKPRLSRFTWLCGLARLPGDSLQRSQTEAKPAAPTEPKPVAPNESTIVAVDGVLPVGRPNCGVRGLYGLTAICCDYM